MLQRLKRLLPGPGALWICVGNIPADGDCGIDTEPLFNWINANMPLVLNLYPLVIIALLILFLIDRVRTHDKQVNQSAETQEAQTPANQ